MAAQAIQAQFDRAEAHLSRLPFTFDDEGFAQAAKACGELVDRLKEIEDGSRARLESKQHEGEVAALVVLLLFEAAENGAPRSNSGRSGKASRRGQKVAAD